MQTWVLAFRRYFVALDLIQYARGPVAVTIFQLRRVTRKIEFSTRSEFDRCRSPTVCTSGRKYGVGFAGFIDLCRPLRGSALTVR